MVGCNALKFPTAMTLRAVTQTRRSPTSGTFRHKQHCHSTACITFHIIWSLITPFLFVVPILIFVVLVIIIVLTVGHFLTQFLEPFLC